MTIQSNPAPQAGAVKLAIALAGTVFVLMMLVGVIMRASQGKIIEIDPALFYQLMTVHGAGMVGTAAFSGACIMWYFLGRYVRLTPAVFWIFLGLFLTGVVLVLVAVLVGGFGAGWTFLYPLPAQSGGAWETWAAVSFILGYISIGVGFLIFHLEAGRAMIKQYGGLSHALGWPLAFGKADPESAPPPTVIAAATITVFNSLGITVGAAVLIITLVDLLIPGFINIDALLAKNMIFFFGHVLINASIYMAVIAVYEIIPEYTRRPWKSSRMLAISWAAVLLIVMAVFPHHLLQDTVMPAWALAMGQIVSYMSGLPLLAVTAFSLLAYLRGSGIRWDVASSLLVLGIAGWSIGSVPAILDSIISVNKVMHNTQWVPGHFHIYLLLGEVAMVFGFMGWLVRQPRGDKRFGVIDRAAFAVYLFGGAGFTLMFLISGAMSVPRRWAVHIEAWILQDQIATGFAVLVVLGSVIFLLRYLGGVLRSD
ncbi:Cytochrome c oxidase (B(O/a)3-type) chain I [hydrothermal vent metagenome]|uniref:Cytochrome c oxidase (B(O/a)3-type) chain I n=1 Tax=hydrothermal vent metagenome TaxID=652676 RepID=A0A3B0RBS1_9ZZZZ